MTDPSKEPLLITGGAGYVGSHVVLAFREAGYPVMVLDDLSTGRRAAVPPDVGFVEGDVGDYDAVRALLTEYGISAVVHLAASVSVPASVRDPLHYYHNNSVASANLIRACIASGVRRFIFSSTAAVYGIPSATLAAEDAPTVPINPYGSSKLVTEWLLRDASVAHDFRVVVLRYFNVAGADPRQRAGQWPGRAEHLIQVACEAALGLREHVVVFGDDYDTQDGTCVRDYIHVRDVAEAHLLALRSLRPDAGYRVFNCGYSHGSSVREVLDTVQAESGVRLDIRMGRRRPGDPSVLVSDPARIRADLHWAPCHDDLGFIVRTVLAWLEHVSVRDA